MRQRVRLTESQLNRIIKNCINEVALNEMNYVHNFFGVDEHAGDFEKAIFQAYRVAGPNNRRKLEEVFPEYFPEEDMRDMDDYTDFDSYKKAHPKYK